MKVRVYISLKNGVLDPQGKAIHGSLQHLGFDNVNSIRQGKLIELEIDETDRTKAEETVTQMCEQLLANTVIENYELEVA